MSDEKTVAYKDIKQDTWQSTKNKLIEVIAKEYERHRYILDTDQISSSEKKIYNPWSVLNCVKREGDFKSYWVNTSDNALISKVVAQANPKFKDVCATLMQGKVVENIKISESVALPEITEQNDFLWGLLLFSGYVTPHATRIVEDITYTDLILPNKELHILFATLIEQLFNKKLKSVDITDLYDALAKANGAEFSKIVATFVLQSMSYYDIAADEPERSYHLFV